MTLYRRQKSRPFPRKRNEKKAKGLPEEALQIPVKRRDIKSTHRNPLHSYTLIMRKQKEKLRKQFHSPLQQKE